MKRCKVRIKYELLSKWLLLPPGANVVFCATGDYNYLNKGFEVFIEGVGPETPDSQYSELVTPVFTTHIPTTANWDEL